MPDTQQHSPTVISYARALLETASEQSQAEAVNADLQALREAIESNPSFTAFLRDPAICDEQRLKSLEAALRGASPLLLNFVRVVAQHGRLGSLTRIADAHEDLLSEQLGKIEVDVIVAQKLDAAQLEQVRQKVSR
jgi:ATP synthase F1 delta subunit